MVVNEEMAMGGGQGKVSEEQISKEKRKALEVKSAGTQHRHPRDFWGGE
jgi:hypothetical protein